VNILSEPEAIYCKRSDPVGAAAPVVLVVDDEESIRCVAWEILRYLGYGVETVPCGEEALARIEAGFHPDAVLLDVVMPGIGGAETFRRLRALRPDLPVIVVSGFTDRASADALAREGVDAVLGKPFGIETLSRKLRETIQK
jgi:two-component system cell cycle sensor histidine kinase/response regulator CckA